MTPFSICLFAIISLLQTGDSCILGNASSTTVTFCDLDVTLRSIMIVRFDQMNFHDLIAKAVRLIFHDCMGPKEDNFGDEIAICDGCIDFQNSAHGGLEHGIVTKIEEIYQSPDNNWHQRLSRADFWAAIATIAIQYSNELSMTTDLHGSTATNESLPYIPFYIGRTDCSASPTVNTNNYPVPFKQFPDALKGWDHNFQLFVDSFGFNEQEYTAILGAHTLGRMQQQNSGFGTGPWVEAWDILDNEFYHLLLDNMEHTRRPMNWTQFPVNSTEPKFQWRNTNGRDNLIMLNSDMALVLNISDKLDENNGGECPCRYHMCGFNDASVGWVEAYAGDNQLWLTDFAEAFRKMILTGYDRSGLEILAEEWYHDQYCFGEEIKQYTQNINGVTSFRENRDGGGYLDQVLTDFIIDNPECGVTITEYYYDFRYRRNRDRLTVSMVICCGQGAIFHDDYVPEEGYSFAGTGEAFTGDVNGDGKLDKNEIKQLIVMIICNVLLVVCCIGICYGAYKYNKKRSAQKEMEQQTVELHAANIQARVEPVGQTNIKYSEETTDKTVYTPM